MCKVKMKGNNNNNNNMHQCYQILGRYYFTTYFGVKSKVLSECRLSEE
jgi:hypothetical protein